MATKSLPGADSLYHIRIRDLRLRAFVGVYEREREIAQSIRIDINLSVRFRKGQRGDDLRNVVNYERILVGVKQLCAERHFQLLETLCQELITLCLAAPLVDIVTIAVEKLEVEPLAAGVGVEMSGSRNEHNGKEQSGRK